MTSRAMVWSPKAARISPKLSMRNVIDRNGRQDSQNIRVESRDEVLTNNDGEAVLNLRFLIGDVEDQQVLGYYGEVKRVS